jgi:hypothetical protein
MGMGNTYSGILANAAESGTGGKIDHLMRQAFERM